MDNLQIYNSVREVPADAQKTISGGRLNGKTDINPMWRIKTLTEQFGACGFGWHYNITKQWLENGSNDEIAAFVNIELFVKFGDDWSKPICGTGGSMFVAKESKGLFTSDECFKMALTDAISVACKALGVGADIYWQKDSTKYSGKQDKSTPPQKEARPINNSQVAELESLKTNFEALINHYKVKKVFDLTYEQAEEALAAKRRQYA